MSNFKIKLGAVPLKLRSLEIYVINHFLFLISKKKKLRSTRFAIFLDGVLTEKRERLNKKTETFIKSTFLSHEI